MPIYDYLCRSCNGQFELLVLKGTVLECPSCHSQEIEQQISSSFAVSTKDLPKARVKTAKARRKTSKDYRDQMVHEAEEIHGHLAEHGVDPGPKPKPKPAAN